MPTTAQRLVRWQGSVGSNSDLRCLSRTWEKLGRRPWSFYIWTICLVKPVDKTMPFVNSIYPYISVYRLEHRCGKRKKTKTYGLEGLNAPLRQGSSLRSQPCPTNGPTATRQLVRQSFVFYLILFKKHRVLSRTRVMLQFLCMPDGRTTRMTRGVWLGMPCFDVNRHARKYASSG